MAAATACLNGAVGGARATHATTDAETDAQRASTTSPRCGGLPSKEIDGSSRPKAELAGASSRPDNRMRRQNAADVGVERAGEEAAARTGSRSSRTPIVTLRVVIVNGRYLTEPTTAASTRRKASCPDHREDARQAGEGTSPSHPTRRAPATSGQEAGSPAAKATAEIKRTAAVGGHVGGYAGAVG